MKLKLQLLIPIIFLLVIPLPAPAENGGELYRDDDVYLGVSIERLSGYSQYEIEGREFGGWPVRSTSWKSRLKWPLDSTLLGPTIGFFSDSEKSNEQGYIEINYRTNVTDEPGEVKDTDWFNGEESLYGEVDTDLTVHTASLLIGKKNYNSGFNVGGETGLVFQYFKWDGSGILTQEVLNQAGSDYTGLPIGTHKLGPEDWIKYEVYNLTLPYKLFLNYRFNKYFLLRGTGKVLIGLAYDRDDHIQVQKKAKSWYWEIGAGGGLEAVFRYDLFEAALSAEYTFIWGKGWQKQDFYGGPLEGQSEDGIDAEIQGQQLSLLARAGIIF